MNGTKHFQHLHDEISPTWDLHHQMRNTDATFPEFAVSANRVDEALFAIWNWHHNNAPERS
jgi:hypothetical protein